MRLSLLTCLAVSVSAFGVQQQRPAESKTALAMSSRREVFGLLAATGFALPQVAGAFSQQLDDYAWEPHQQATNGILDLNSAFVGEYMQLRGMYPSAAGKISSNGPYVEVGDIYDIPGISEHDIDMFKKYENHFTVNPPGRSFYERINARVST